MDALIQSLVQANFAPERIIPRAPMARYTTFRVGGEADVLVDIASAEDVTVALRAARHAGVPVTVIGNGSNLLVLDGGIRGLVLRLAGSCSAIRREGNLVLAQAGASLHAVASFAQAGAYGGELSQVVTRVDAIALSDGKPLSFSGPKLDFSYRHSAMMDAGVVVTDVTLSLSPGDPAALRERMEALSRARREKQPLEYPSAGSTFKRPEGLFAARLIDECGLRGLRVGNAQVSEKHAGFIINLGGATARDILTLITEVTRRVQDATGVHLEPEVRILGEEAG